MKRGCGVPRISIFSVFRRGGRPPGAYLASAVGGTERFSPHADNGVEVGRQFAVECCRDHVTRPGADVDVPFIAKSREAVAEFGFDADLENVCTSHDMTQ